MSKIYYNPACGTCRNALHIMEEAGEKPEIIEYLKTPPSKEDLVALLDQMGIGPMEAVRKKGQAYEDHVKDKNLGREDLIHLMVTHPVLIERPIVITDKGAKICRPAEEVKELL